ncbi:tripartite tricarboxylate transporter TctB family protein [Halomonas sp. FME1]|uniref:Tripartite tricarboxylate transporter TctB family protein n=1 Tax=Halomonas casei TaxID=2742613 RepID=A0ABR9EWF6_9GAMM|nr:MULTISPECIES: tripartite tricarboxylate transporter TctB family protein [Halomonas]MBE0398565.1 tripartite tricarboxylate transporter TctB family protein [Halomonas casei]PCC21495.1 tripartite tricarboxylate transporter [Halomonas sp. JB37]
MRDVLIGIGFVIAGVVTIFIAQQFPTLPSLQFGPSLFPSIVGGGFCIGGVVLMLSGMWQRHRGADQMMQGELQGAELATTELETNAFETNAFENNAFENNAFETSALNATESEGAEHPSGKKSWVMVLPPLMIVFYVLASPYIGALFAMMIIMFSLMMLRKTALYVAVAASVGVSLAIYFIFSHYLLVPLPQGVLLGGSLPWTL